MPKKKFRVSKKTAVTAGVGLGLAAIAAASAYLLSKPANRKKAARLASQVKVAVAKQLKKLKKIDERTYRQVVAQVVRQYQSAKGVDLGELRGIGSELVKHWQGISRTVRHAQSAARRAVVRVKRNRRGGR